MPAGPRSFIRFYKFSFVKALMAVFPEIGLEEIKFHKQPSTFIHYLLIKHFLMYIGKFWRSIEARRAVFNNFARQRGFNPLVGRNWIGLSRYIMQSDMVTRDHKVLKLFFPLRSNLPLTTLQMTVQIQYMVTAAIM
jgi:hypothetical protein